MTTGIKGQLEIWVDDLEFEIKMSEDEVRRPGTEPKSLPEYILRIWLAVVSIRCPPVAGRRKHGAYEDLIRLQARLKKLYYGLGTNPLKPNGVEALKDIWAIVRGSGSSVSCSLSTLVIVQI